MTKRIIIDTDPGVDDALTFLLALASPEIKLEALTTVQGNVTIEKATRNALSVLELAHASHIPVVQGCSHPLLKRRTIQAKLYMVQPELVKLFCLSRKPNQRKDMR